jgi:transmembrane sensor
MENTNIKKLLFSYFAGGATPLEKKLIEEWLHVPANRERYFEWLEEYDCNNLQYPIEEELAFDRFQTVLEVPQTAAVKPLSKASVWPWVAVLKYAASVALVLSLSYYLYPLIQQKEYKTGFGEVLSFTLQDGSHVTLNANSTLKVSRFGFGQRQRFVELAGEAEFNVVHTRDNKKFLIHTPDGLEVEVVGTEFVVYSRSKGSKVVLNKGKVLLRSLGDTTRKVLEIKPGDVVTHQKGAFKLTEKQDVSKHVSWKEHRFTFDRTSVQDIADEIEVNFGVRMLVPDSVLAKREITGTYDAADADELIGVLAKVLDADVQKSRRTIIMNPKRNQ